MAAAPPKRGVSWKAQSQPAGDGATSHARLSVESRSPKGAEREAGELRALAHKLLIVSVQVEELQEKIVEAELETCVRHLTSSHAACSSHIAAAGCVGPVYGKTKAGRASGVAATHACSNTPPLHATTRRELLLRGPALHRPLDPMTSSHAGFPEMRPHSVLRTALAPPAQDSRT